METPITDAFVATWAGADPERAIHAAIENMKAIERVSGGYRAALEEIRSHDGGNRYNYTEITELVDEVLGQPEPGEGEG